jgi:transcriptional regulator with XRE-family HTH domain
MRYRLRQRRERLGLTQELVAWRAGRISQSIVSLAERGGRSPHVQAIRRVLAQAECHRHKQRLEASRIRRQRALLAQLGPEGAKAALIKGLLDRAWILLDSGMEGCIAADALLEFVPEQLADELLREFFEGGDDG